MKKYTILTGLLLLAIAIPCVMAGENEKIETSIWSAGTAFSMPAGRFEFGLFQPLTYGLSKSVELSTHLLPNIFMPNAGIKWTHGTVGKCQWASRHSIYYPTSLLRLVAKEGIGGLISPEFTIPDMVALHNEVLLTRVFNPHLCITAKAGVTVALVSEDPDPRSTIDMPLIFPRLSVFYHTVSIRMGLNVQGRLYLRWHYLMNSDFFLIPDADENFTFEQTAFLLWRKSPRFQSGFGCKLIYGEYPFGTQWHLIPLFDTQWAFQIKK